MQKYDSLKNIIAIVGENELSPADRQDYQNAKKLINFFSQDFAVAEHLTGKPGEYFSITQTLDGIEAILASKGNEDPTAKAKPVKDTKASEPKPVATPETKPPETKEAPKS